MKPLFIALFFVLAFSWVSAETKSAELVLNHDQVAVLVDTQGAYLPQDRVENSKEKIESLYDLPLVEAGDFKTEQKSNFFEISFREQPLLTLTQKDAEASGVDFTLDGVKPIQDKVYRHVNSQTVARSPKKLALAATYVLISLIVYLLLIRLIFSFKTKLRSFIEGHSGKIESYLPFLRRFPLIKEDFIINIGLLAVELAFITSLLVVSYLVLPIAFSFLPWTQHWADALFGFVRKPVVWILSGLAELLPNLFFIIVVIVACRYLLRALKFFFHEIERGNVVIDGFHTDWATPTYKLIRIMVFALALVVCFPYIPGSSSPAFQGVSVFIGLLLSLGSSSAISNVIAGIVLTYMRPFRIGDRVKIADTIGDVIQRELLVTRVRTIKNDDITIPNATILQNHIINYSSMADQEGLILHTIVTIGYDVPYEQVEAALIEAALATQDFIHEPKPFVFQTALNDFHVSYQINAYTKNARAMARIYSDLHRNIQLVFARHKIEIMSPNYHAMRDGNKITIPQL